MPYAEKGLTTYSVTRTYEYHSEAVRRVPESQGPRLSCDGASKHTEDGATDAESASYMHECHSLDGYNRVSSSQCAERFQRLWWWCR
jgi:hypothetical protein